EMQMLGGRGGSGGGEGGYDRGGDRPQRSAPPRREYGGGQRSAPAPAPAAPAAGGFDDGFADHDLPFWFRCAPPCGGARDRMVPGADGLLAVRAAFGRPWRLRPRYYWTCRRGDE